jgi:hypothetical protein
VIEGGLNYSHYEEDGTIDVEKTCESYLDYMASLSFEDNNGIRLGDNEIGHVYVALTTPSSSHWYEKPIAGFQGSHYSHTGLTFDNKMTSLYHVRSKGLMVTKRKEFEKEKIGIDLYEYEVSLKEKRRMQNLVRHMINVKTKYDFLMIGKLLGKIIFKRKDKEGDKKVSAEEIIEKKKYICSGWVAGVIAATVPKFRRYLFINKKKWVSFMPEDFVKVKDLELKKRLVFPENKVYAKFD